MFVFLLGCIFVLTTKLYKRKKNLPESLNHIFIQQRLEQMAKLGPIFVLVGGLWAGQSWLL